MHLQLPALALFSTLFAFSTALPHESVDDVDGLTFFSLSVSDQSLQIPLAESGQLVSTPLEFDNDGEEVSFLNFAVDGLGLDEDEDKDNDNETVTAAIFEEWKATVVRTHNEYRRHYGAPAVTWSDALYAGTNQWATQCKFEHSDGHGQYGENLAAGTGNSYGYVDGLKSWMDEVSKYDYNHPGFSSGTGHFTQVVWKSSKQVACAIANCRAGTIFGQASKNIVCRYSPAGNFGGRYVENVGRYQN